MDNQRSQSDHRKMAPERKRHDSLTDAKELRVHAVEVGDEEDSIRPCDIEEEQVTGAQIQKQAASVHHQQTDQLHREDRSEKKGVWSLTNQDRTER